jgi:hypothetical protein
MGLFRLIKYVGLELTYKILYSCFDTTQTWYMVFKVDNFFYTTHEPNMNLTQN